MNSERTMNTVKKKKEYITFNFQESLNSAKQMFTMMKNDEIHVQQDKQDEPEVMQFRTPQKLFDFQAMNVASPSSNANTTLQSIHPHNSSTIPYPLENNYHNVTSGGGTFDSSTTILRDALRLARDSVKLFEAHVSVPALKHTTDLCVEGIKQVGNALVQNLSIPQSAGLLNIIAEIIHRVLNTIKSAENIEKLGQNLVIESVDRFLELIEQLMQNIGSYGVTQSWLHSSSLENLQTAFPISSCVIRKKLTLYETQAHAKLFLFKGDLLRYRCNIANLPYGGACKAYWMAFSLLPGQGIVFNLLGVIAVARDVNDRLSQIFYFMRAISTTTPFEHAKDLLVAIFEKVSIRMIQTDSIKQADIFKDFALIDNNGIQAVSQSPLHPHEYYFSWLSPVMPPEWKEKLSRFTRSATLNMIIDNLFHMLNLLITKHNHPTLFESCERFLTLILHVIEKEEITVKEVLQITTIFILALKTRHSVDATFKLVSQTFLRYIGLLYSKFYKIMLQRNDPSPSIPLEQKAMLVLPSLAVIDSYWDSLEEKIKCAYDGATFKSKIFEFSTVRKNIAHLGHLLSSYLQNLNVSIKRAQGFEELNNVYILPETILCCMGSRFSVNAAPIQLCTLLRCSETLNTFLIRALLAQDLLKRMLNRQYFGISPTFDLVPGAFDLSPFEIAVTADDEDIRIFAVYPEYFVVDTALIVCAHDILKPLARIGLKFVIPDIVLAELKSLAEDNMNPPKIRGPLQLAENAIQNCIANHRENFFLFDRLGNRKFLLDECIPPEQPLDDSQVHYGEFPFLIGKHDYIIRTCQKLAKLFGPKPDCHGFSSPNIIATNVLLLSNNNTFCALSRRHNVPSTNFEGLLTWLRSESNLNEKNGKKELVEILDTVTPEAIKKSFTLFDVVMNDPPPKKRLFPSSSYDPFGYITFETLEPFNVEHENGSGKKYPHHAYDLSPINKYPVGIIPPNYSRQNGIWTGNVNVLNEQIFECHSDHAFVSYVSDSSSV